ncbi:MAG: c-type cytochrome [Hyphomicrobiaceae bacterium]
MTPAAIAELMRPPPHNSTADMISDEELARVAAFVREGRHDADRHIERATAKAEGDAKRGAELFQNICAMCHGFDGRLHDWGTKDAPAFVGTEAQAFPAEGLHKMRYAHPGAAMVSLRALPLQDAVDVLTYAHCRSSRRAR